MTPKQILKKRQSIELKIVALKQQIEELQSVCTHENVTKHHFSNSGSWDSTREYWTTFTCPDCGKNWTVDGSK